MEVWKDIEDHPNYEVSSLGNIRNKTTQYILSNNPGKRGYCSVRLDKKTYQTHILVCTVFHGFKPSLKHSVDHINRITNDNRIENLRWATHSVQVKNRKVSNQRKGFPIWKVCPKTSEKLELFENCIRVVESFRLPRIKRANVITAIKNKSIWNGYFWIFKTIDYKDNETWKEFNRNGKTYLVSTDGRIKDLKNREINVNKYDYYKIVCNHKDYLVHRIVAEVFLPNFNNNKIVNHKNGNKYDNRLVNLEWTTYRKNSLHAYENGLIKKHAIKKVYKICYKTNIILQEYESAIKVYNVEGISLYSIQNMVVKDGVYYCYKIPKIKPNIFIRQFPKVESNKKKSVYYQNEYKKIIYPSLNKAAKENKIPLSTLRLWIKRGDKNWYWN